MSEPTHDEARASPSDVWSLTCNRCKSVNAAGPREVIKAFVMGELPACTECKAPMSINWSVTRAQTDASLAERDTQRAFARAEVSESLLAAKIAAKIATASDAEGTYLEVAQGFHQRLGHRIAVRDKEHGCVELKLENGTTVSLKSPLELDGFIAREKVNAATGANNAATGANMDAHSRELSPKMTLSDALAILKARGLTVAKRKEGEVYDVFSEGTHLGHVFSAPGETGGLDVMARLHDKAVVIKESRGLDAFGQTQTPRPSLVKPTPASQVDEHGGFDFDAVSTDPPQLLEWVFRVDDASKNFKVYAVSGESGAGKSTLAATLIPQYLGAEHTLVYSLDSSDTTELNGFAHREDPILTCRRRLLMHMYSESEVTDFVGDQSTRNAGAVRLLIKCFESACRDGRDKANTSNAEMEEWLKSTDRMKLGRTVFVIDEVGRGLAFAASIMSDRFECFQALHSYCTEVHLVFCGTMADSVSSALEGTMPLIVTNPNLAHGIRVLPQRNRVPLEAFVRSRLEKMMLQKQDAVEILGHCDSPFFYALWSNPRLAMRWVTHIRRHLSEPSSSVASKLCTRYLCALDVRCSASHAARDYPYLNGLRSLDEKLRLQLCNFAYVMLCRLYSAHRDNPLYWHLRQSGWMHADASCFSSNFLMKRHASQSGSSSYAELRKLLLDTRPEHHAQHFAIYFVLKRMGLQPTKVADMKFDCVSAIAIPTYSMNEMAAKIDGEPGVNSGASTPCDASGLREDDISSTFQHLLKHQSAYGEIAVAKLFEDFRASNAAPVWETSSESRHWLYPSSMLSDKKIVEESLEKCLRLGLLLRTGSGAIEASPGLCLALCSDFGATEAIPSDGMSFEAVVAQAYVRRGRLEGLRTRMFHLSEPLPPSKGTGGVSAVTALAISNFLKENDAGVGSMAVIVNGPSAQGPDLFVVTRPQGSERVLVQCVGIKHTALLSGTWTHKMKTLGFDLTPDRQREPLLYFVQPSALPPPTETLAPRDASIVSQKEIDRIRAGHDVEVLVRDFNGRIKKHLEILRGLQDEFNTTEEETRVLSALQARMEDKNVDVERAVRYHWSARTPEDRAKAIEQATRALEAKARKAASPEAQSQAPMNASGAAKPATVAAPTTTAAAKASGAGPKPTAVAAPTTTAAAKASGAGPKPTAVAAPTTTAAAKASGAGPKPTAVAAPTTTAAAKASGAGAEPAAVAAPTASAAVADAAGESPAPGAAEAPLRSNAERARYWISHLAFGPPPALLPVEAHANADFEAVLHETAIVGVETADACRLGWSVYDRDALGPWGVLVHRREDDTGERLGRSA